MATATKKKKETFTIEVDGQELALAVQRPNQLHLAEAQKAYNKAFSEAVNSGAIVRAKIEEIMRAQNLWNDELKKEAEDVLKEIIQGEKKLNGGGMKLKEAVQLALHIGDLRDKQRVLLSKRNQLDANTAEALAEGARFNRLVSLCTVYNETGNPYFSSYGEYLERADEKVATEAASKLAYMIYNLDPNFEANLPENKFLRQWKRVDDQMRLINQDGHLVDREGRLVDDKGRFVDKDGNYVDRDGNPVDVEGNYTSQTTQPFLDDDGNPISPPA